MYADSLSSPVIYQKQNTVSADKWVHGLAHELDCFESHDLALQDKKVRLMNRIDTKFLLSADLLPEILSCLNRHYTVLYINDNRVFLYNNTYYDSEKFYLYQCHHNSTYSRYKVRRRRYVDDGSVFLEVKEKTNKGRTLKSRIKVQASEHSANIENISKADKLMRSSGVPESISLEAKLTNSYRRITLVNKTMAERVTFDFDLQYWRADGTYSRSFDGLLVAELKQARLNRDSPLYQLMRHCSIRSSSFSKYCMGCNLVLPDQLPKKNLFKPVYRIIDSIDPCLS